MLDALAGITWTNRSQRVGRGAWAGAALVGWDEVMVEFGPDIVV